jgi:hypothetical protein
MEGVMVPVLVMVVLLVLLVVLLVLVVLALLVFLGLRARTAPNTAVSGADRPEVLLQANRES